MAIKIFVRPIALYKHLSDDQTNPKATSQVLYQLGS